MEKLQEQAPVRTRMLVVDDDPWVLQICQKTLSDFAHVVMAQSAAEALDMLDDANFDTVLTDLHMPAIDGLDLVSAVTMLHPDTRCLMMTGCPPED
ncbi:MAG: response regulator, partial [Candidatus Xenobia bacterium]